MIISIILSAMAALAAILAPVLTTIINNRKELKLKNMEMIYAEKYKVYKDFFDRFGAIHYARREEDFQKMYTTLHEVCLFCDKNAQNELMILFKFLRENKNYPAENADKQFLKCCDLLKEDLSKEKINNKY